MRKKLMNFVTQTTKKPSLRINFNVYWGKNVYRGPKLMNFWGS